MARACEAGGADALTLVNTFVGMAIDVERRARRLGRPTGGLSGPAIKPLALARCHEVAGAVHIPVIGIGGIVTGRDALEFMLVGASAVQVGTANFARPRAPRRLARCARGSRAGVAPVADLRRRRRGGGRHAD